MASREACNSNASVEQLIQMLQGGRGAEITDEMISGLSVDERREYFELQDAIGLLDKAKRGEDQMRIESATMLFDSTAADAPTDFVVNQTATPEKLGHYEVIETVARGGFGIVLKARDTKLGRIVALKIPKLETLFGEPEAGQRFAREARLVAMLGHPAIVPVYETGSDGSILFIASAFCNGGTLGYWLQRRTNQCVFPRLAAKVVSRLAEAVQHAHTRGVIHRDLKPGNVLLHFENENTADDDDTVVDALRITDFGLAKFIATDQNMTRTGATIGTPAYMSPEQASGKVDEIGVASDVYSLGAILYQLLTGHPPILEKNYLATMRAIETRTPESPRRINRVIPRDLEAICLKCLEKNPRDRYESAQQLQDDLQRMLAGQPVNARPVGPITRLNRWCRRNPLVAGLAVTTLAVLILGLAATNYQYRIAQQNLEQTKQNYRQARAAVDDLLVAAGDPALEALPDVRQKLLERSLEYYNWFVVQEQDDPSLQMDRILAFRSVAGTARKLGSNDDALRAYQDAQALLDELVDESSPIDQKLMLFQNQIDIGLIHDIKGKFAEARNVYETAIEYGEQLERQNPDHEQLQASLGRAYKNLGYVYREQHEFERALGYYQLALETRQWLVATFPENEEHLHRLGLTNSSLADLYVEQKQPAKALAAAEEYLRQSQKVLEVKPDEFTYRLSLVSSQNRLGDVIRNFRLGDDWSNVAAAHYQQGIHLARELVNEFPSLIAPQRHLVNCLANLADVYRNSGNPEAAIESYRESIDILQQAVKTQPERASRYAGSLATALHRQGTQYYLLNEFDDARQAFSLAAVQIEKFIAERDNQPRAQSIQRNIYFSAASLEYRAGNHQKSLDELEKYFQAGGTHARARLLMARNLLFGPKELRDAKQAAEILREEVKKSGVSATTRAHLATAEFYVGDHESAKSISASAILLLDEGDDHGLYIRAIGAAIDGRYLVANQYLDRGDAWLTQQIENNSRALEEYRELQVEARHFVKESERQFGR